MTRARNIAGFSTITTTPSPVHVGPIGVLTATRIDGEFNVVDIATRDLTAQGIGVTNLQVSGITTGLNVSGIITAQNGINFNGTSTGLNVSGVGTIATLNVTGNATIAGVLTYEDVTNVDSVGVVTARGLSIFGNTTGLNAGISTFTGDVSIADKIIHTGDTNTAIRFPAADTVTVETAGNERIRVDSDGKLGVNNGAVASIKAQLDVINTTAPTLDNNTHAGEALFLRSGGSDGNGNVQAVMAFGKADSSSLRSGSAIASVQTDSDADKIGIGFYTSPSSTSSQTLSQKVLITHSGLVGIGTDNPTSGAAGARVNIYFKDETTYDSTTNRANGLIVYNSASGGYSSLELAQRTTSGNTYGSAIINAVDPSDGNTYGADLTFQTRATGSGNYGERMRITGAGLVGIGTITPLGSLDVRDASGSDPTMFVGHSDADVEGEFLRVGRVDLPAIRYHSIKAKHGGAAANNYISFNLHNAASTTSQSEVLRVLGNGKVGIGTDAPRAGVLHVGSCPATPGSVFSASPMSVFASSNLGATAGNSNKIAIFGGQTAGNVSGLSLYHYRAADGASWTTDGFSFRQEVDNSSNIYDYLSFKGGKVGINTSVPEEYLDVYHNGVNYNVFGRFCSANGGQAGIELVAGSGSVNRATRIDFVNMNTSSTPQWTLINDYQQTGTNDFGLYHGSEKAIVANPDSSVELMHNGTTRFYTTSTGAQVNGNNGNIFVASCATNSTANVVFQNTENNTAGDMRLLIKTAANQGSDPYIKFDAGGSDMIVGTHYLGTTNNQLRLGAGTYVHTVNGIQIDGNGNVYMNALNSGSGASDLRYNTSSKQVFYDSSSRLVKTDIEDLSYGLDAIKQLKPRIYKRTDTDGDIEIGFIADEVVNIIPEIVPTAEKSLFTKNEEDTEIVPSYVEYKRLTAVLTKAVQELSAEVEQLKSQLNN